MDGQDDFPLYPVEPWDDTNMLDPRTFVSLHVVLRPEGGDERDGWEDAWLARTPSAEVVCDRLSAALCRGGLNARVDASEPGVPRADAFVRVQVAGRLHLAVMVGDGGALLTAHGLQDRRFDAEAEIAQVRAVLAAVEEVTGWLPVNPEQRVEDPLRRVLVRAAPGWRRGMPDGPPPKTMKQTVDELLAAPPEPAEKHPEVVARLLRDVEDVVARGKDRWARRWSVRAVDEDLPWLRLTGVDGVRVSREDPSVVLTVWVEDRQTLWVRQERDGTRTTDALEDREEVLRVVRAVVDDALVPWRGRLTRRSRGWQGRDARGRLRLHAALRPVGPPPEPPR